MTEINDLRESNETIQKITEQIQKEQEELKNLIDMLNREKQDWVLFHDVFMLISFIHFSLYSRLKELMLKISKKRFVIWKIYL